MNKSAMQELIEWIQVYCDHQPYLLPEEAINKATELLQKERKQIEDFGKKCVEIAVSNCSYDKEEEIIECDYSMAHKEITDYYNKTYKQ